ncbi:putative reverse transcriptase domain-containing protein [Tanacetum coccineum]
MGDFNVALTLEDYSSSSSKLSSAIRDFKECVYNIEVMDVNSSGLQFTWNPKPKGEGGLMKKLDRIMGNTEFIDAFLGSYELFQPYRISDHSPAVLHIPNLPCCKPKPFKFFNFLAHKRQFKELVSNAWNMSLRMELDSVQKALYLNPSDVCLREEEAIYVQAFVEAKLDEERFLKEKAKIECLPLTKDVSWGWLKLLQLREQVRPFLWVKLGNGKSSSIWYDSWCAHSPLINFISPRDIYREGFELSSKVAELIVNNAWSWPQTWITKAPILLHIPAPNLDVHSHDAYRWRGLNGSSVSRAWDAFRPRGNEVPWFKIVWFPHSIPRHSFHLWLVMRNSLKTQDRLRQWDVGNNVDLNLLVCPLCSAQQDSHAHLFFECAYSSQPMAHKRTVRSIFGKLILAAATYFVWLERNNRLFKKTKRTPEELKDVIMITVRIKLLSFRFKNSVKEGKSGMFLSWFDLHLGHVSLELGVVQAKA